MNYEDSRTLKINEDSDWAGKIDGITDLEFVSPPKYKWIMSLVCDKTLQFYLPEAPNRFHRFMQRWVLGVYWEKINEGE